MTEHTATIPNRPILRQFIPQRNFEAPGLGVYLANRPYNIRQGDTLLASMCESWHVQGIIKRGDE